MKNEATRAMSQAELQPIIDYCAANRGAMAAIQRAFSQATGQPCNRANIEGWLRKDPARRIEPSFGAGLLLVKISNEMIKRVNDFESLVMSIVTEMAHQTSGRLLADIRQELKERVPRRTNRLTVKQE